ncbi:MAG: sugar ABC transporter ATP-binding protein [Treponema sp.]|jgi:ABC-type sugar transport system ATPase subunit|nr:sugar ABC transporter ATP-binding protein [Treponema sp.]
MAQDVICKISHITKWFPGVTALKDINFEIERGKVHAVVGENGAGKSTLMNILSGVYHADQGTVEFEGTPVLFSQPRSAQLAGIAMIHQELSLAQHMSAAENVFEGRLPKNKLGFVDRKKMYRDCENLLARLGVSHINPKSLVKNLSVSEMQLLEIVKALSLEARMLIMDEPTSSLTSGEIDFLLRIVDKLRQEGVSTLYISHKLEEVMFIADTITVLRDGQHIATRLKTEMDEKTMINLMVGRDFDKIVHREYMTGYERKTPLLEIRNLSDLDGKVRNVSFSLYPGEVLGLTGLVGAGRTELLQSIFGAQKIKTGDILMNGRKVAIKHPRDAIRLGMGLIPEGRKIQGLFLKMPVEDNMIMVVLRTLCNKLGLIQKRRTRGLSAEYVEKLAIKTPSIYQIVNNLSGGNQQKTIVARWLMNNPKILLMDEPTHGIDIGAKAEIYRIIDDLSKTGVSIILLSSEMPEVLSLCDRIMVMHHGELRGIMPHAEADQVKIMSYTLEKTG